MKTAPKTLHLLCIGDVGQPRGLDVWTARHPDWQLRVWTDNDLDERSWRLRSRMAELIASQGPAARDQVAALMRWEILAEHGGVVLLPGRRVPDTLEPRLQVGGSWVEDVDEGWMACPSDHEIVTAAVRTELAARSTARGRINILMMTVRTGSLMRRITELLAADCRRLPGVRLTVADGSEDADKARWLRDLAALGGDVRVICQREIGPRFSAGLTDEHEWTLLVADDDSFSLDYVDVYLEHLAQVSSDVSMVAPSAYVQRLGEIVQCNMVEKVRAVDPATRLASWVSQRHVQGLAYYSAVRTSVLLEWHRYCQSRPYMPSYVDQLLTALAALRGGIDRVRGCSALTRDDTDWAVAESSIRLDMRTYPQADMVLLHELWWIADYVRLLGLAGRPELAVAARQRAVDLLGVLHYAWPARERLASPRASVDWDGMRERMRLWLIAMQNTKDPSALEREFLAIEAYARAAEISLLLKT